MSGIDLSGMDEKELVNLSRALEPDQFFSNDGYEAALFYELISRNNAGKLSKETLRVVINSLLFDSFQRELFARQLLDRTDTGTDDFDFVRKVMPQIRITPPPKLPEKFEASVI